MPATSRARRTTIITSLPKPDALAATAAAIAKAGVPPPRHHRDVDLHARGQRRAPKARCARPAMSCSTARSAAPARRPRSRISWSMPRAAPAEIKKLRPLFAGFTRAVHDVGAFGNGSRMKYVANLLVAIHNVASAEAMVLGMKAGSAAAAYLRSGQDRRRQFARLRTARADDGEEQLQRRHDEDLGLAERHGRDRRLCPQDRRADADVRRLSAIYAKALKSGHGADDTAAVCAVLEAMAGVKRAQARRQARRAAIVTIQTVSSNPSFHLLCTTGIADPPAPGMTARRKHMSSLEGEARMAAAPARPQRPISSAAKPATACASIGTCRSRWTTASCCAPTCFARSPKAAIR